MFKYCIVYSGIYYNLDSMDIDDTTKENEPNKSNRNTNILLQNGIIEISSDENDENENKNVNNNNDDEFTPFKIIECTKHQNKKFWIFDTGFHDNVNTQDVRNNRNEWEKMVEYMSNNSKENININDMETIMDFVIIDQYIDEETEKLMICYAQSLDLEDLNELGFTDQQVHDLLFSDDYRNKRVKLEKNPFNVTHKWYCWLQWMQLVDVKHAFHCAKTNGKINSWIFIVFNYYVCGSLFNDD